MPAKKPPTVDLPHAELRARVEVVSRALDDVRALMSDADPIADPVGFAEREKKALAIFDEIPSVLPLGEPLSDERRAELEAELEEAPDEDVLRQILTLAIKVMDDPSISAEARAELAAHDPREALASLDRALILQKAADDARALAEDMEAQSQRQAPPAPRVKKGKPS